MTGGFCLSCLQYCPYLSGRDDSRFCIFCLYLSGRDDSRILFILSLVSYLSGRDDNIVLFILSLVPYLSARDDSRILFILSTKRFSCSLWTKACTSNNFVIDKISNTVHMLLNRLSNINKY